VDKPVTTTLAEARRRGLDCLAEMDRGGGVPCTRAQVADGDFRTVQELTSPGSLGKIVRFESAFLTVATAGTEQTPGKREPEAGAAECYCDLAPQI